MKKIIFFDGDGTLWYPEATKRKVKPFWVYTDESTRDNYLKHLIVAPEVVKTLTDLKNRGIKLIVLSTHPDHLDNADQVLHGKMKHFDLHKIIDEFHATAEYPAAKGEKISELLEKYSIDKSEALMVGDSYRWDYQPAVDVGVDAILIDSSYHQEHLGEEMVDKSISEVNEIFKYL